MSTEPSPTIGRPGGPGGGVRSARRRLIDELAQPDTLGFGFHFGDQPFGRVIAGAGEEATWQPEPTLSLAAPPR